MEGKIFLRHNASSSKIFFITIHEKFTSLIIQRRLRKGYDHKASNYLKHVLQLKVFQIKYFKYSSTIKYNQDCLILLYQESNLASKCSHRCRR